jgi:hypothetical protein
VADEVVSETVAVNVTLWPWSDGLAELTTMVPVLSAGSGEFAFPFTGATVGDLVGTTVGGVVGATVGVVVGAAVGDVI